MEWISVALAAFPKSNDRAWQEEPALDFFALKNQVHALIEATGLSLPKGLWTTISGEPTWQDGYSARLGDAHKNKLEINLGILALSLTKAKEAKGPILAAEILIDPILLNKRKKPTSFTPFSTFPPAIKDLALVVDHSNPQKLYDQAWKKLPRKLGMKNLRSILYRFFDLFAGTGLPEGKKSLALTLRFVPLTFVPLERRN